MLPVPRFTPTVRKSRPQPIDLMQGVKKVKVCLPSPFPATHVCLWYQGPSARLCNSKAMQKGCSWITALLTHCLAFSCAIGRRAQSCA